MWSGFLAHVRQYASRAVTRNGSRAATHNASRAVRRALLLPFRAVALSLSRRISAGRGDAGMSTAEYAIGTVAACAFAALLYKVITSSQVLSLLMGVVTRALHVPF